MQKDKKHQLKLLRDDYFQRTISRLLGQPTARDKDTFYNMPADINKTQERKRFVNPKVEFLYQKFLQLKRPPHKYSWDDKGRGELFAIVIKDLLRYNASSKSWIYFNGKVWIDDVGNCIVTPNVMLEKIFKNRLKLS